MGYYSSTQRCKSTMKAKKHEQVTTPEESRGGVRVNTSPFTAKHPGMLHRHAFDCASAHCFDGVEPVCMTTTEGGDVGGLVGKILFPEKGCGVRLGVFRTVTRCHHHDRRSVFGPVTWYIVRKFGGDVRHRR